ncbi:MAG TPA: HD domain-containing protein [candidate division Zixibacteria bacterium]|nr:HD domain-containing protein [candidate division Zixibacteria bacterium]
MVQMKKIIRSSKDFEKKKDTTLTNGSKVDPTAGLSDTKTPTASKGIILPGSIGTEEEALVELSGLELPPDEAPEDGHDEQVDDDEQVYRAACAYVDQFMTDPNVLDINLLAEHAHNIINRMQHGVGMQRLAMRPKYLVSFSGAHPVNISIMAALLSDALRFDEQERLRTVVASLVHDIGMSQLPVDILQNDRKLTDEEVAELRQHPNYSAELIRSLLGDSFDWLATVVSQEHERAQGQGYPSGLMLSAIEPMAQIIGLLDVYEAFTHPRRQHLAASPSKIVRQIIESKDQIFSQRMVKALLQSVSIYPIETSVLLNNGQIGRVIATHPRNTLRPIIELQTDHNGKRLGQTKQINLAENPVLSIVRAMESEELADLSL